MKNIFTYGIFLFFLVGIGNNVQATAFTSRLSGISGVPSARGYRIGAWNAKSTWYDPSVIDTATVVVPTYNDDVTISAGDSIYLGNTSYAKTLTVNGTVCMYNGAMNINGDLTVNSTGVFSMKSNAYCSNIYNYGKLWCYNTAPNGSPKSLYVGYTYAGSLAGGTGDYTIVNDGIFGSLRSNAVAGVIGGGFYLLFSNLAKSLTIQHSVGVTSGYAFSIAAIYPDTKTTVSQDFNLNIKESIALLRTSTQPSFTLTNGDVFLGFNRTCTIFPTDTVFVAGGFHVKGGSSQPSASIGNITYNVYGCLDVATLHPSSTYNEFNLGATSAAGNTSTLTLNVGDGTQANAGTLVLGKTIKVVRTSSSQTVTFNPSAYSTVTFGYASASPTITLTTNAVVDNTLFPTSFYNLTSNNSVGGSVTLPTGLNINVSNALTLTSGKFILGTTNLSAGSISGGSSTSYVVTDNTGTLTVPTTTATATLFPIGASATTSYDPVTITPTTGTSTAVKVTATLSGTANSGINYNLREWTVTPATASASLLAFTPSLVDATVASMIAISPYYALIGRATGSATYINLNSSYSSGTYSSTYSSFGSFVTGINSNATALQNANNNLLIYPVNNSLIVRNAKQGDLVSVYGISGLKVASSVVIGDNTTMSLKPGIYIVKTGSTIQRVIVQ